MGVEIIDGFKFQIGINDSKKLIIESSKLDACIKYILDGNIKSITINCSPVRRRLSLRQAKNKALL